MPDSDHGRPDPDALLRKLVREEQQSRRGRLRVYLGAAPGVGKTFAMLNEGRRRLARGTDVVVGYVEHYNRPLTREALEGLPVIPRKSVEYRGVTLEEMDVDAILARHPQVALIDELAHTNAPGSRNEKRWQDVDELLTAGVTVISTVNIQHLESLNDVVFGITGVRVRETVPDRIIDEADEVEVVDISPEALRARMRHGNIYPTEQALRALEGFFRPGNLAALRELALRRVTQEVEQDLVEYMHEHGLSGWETTERVLVLVDNTHASERALRRARRLANAFNGELFAAYPAPAQKKPGMVHILSVAQDLNAELRELPGDDVLGELGTVIRSENIVHVVLIHTESGPFRRAALHDRLLKQNPSIDVVLVGRER